MLAAWAATSAALATPPDHHPWLLAAAAAATVPATALLLRRYTRDARLHRAVRLVAVVLLTAAAATTTTVLHTADLHRGPVPALARPSMDVSAPGASAPGPSPAPPTSPSTIPPPRSSSPPTVPADLSSHPAPAAQAVPADRSTLPADVPVSGSPGQVPAVLVELTVAGDPRTRTGRARGTLPGQDVLTFDAVVDQVTPPVAPVPGDRPGAPARVGSEAVSRAAAVRTHTPVTVLVRAQDIPAWRGLIPSTRVAAVVRIGPPGDHDPGSAALLTAAGPPRLTAAAGPVQRLASRLRTGLRSACDHLPPDTRGLLPGLVVGDTSRLPDDLQEAFRATDLGHLVAVSGANLAIVLTVLLGGPGHREPGARGGIAGLLGLSLRTTAIAGTGLTLAFVTVCRPEPSVLRAAATGLIGLLALATGRPRSGVPVLAGAVLLLILFDPFLARSYGFLLSTLATVGLLVLAPRWAAALRDRGWPPHLATAVAAAAAAQACCAPVTILLAPRVSLVALPCNLLAEAAVAPATLLGFAALAVEPVAPAAARVIADLAAVPAGWLVAVARHGADLPGAEFAWSPGPAGAVLLAVITVALCWAVPGVLRAGAAVPVRARAVVALLATLLLLGALVRPTVLTRLATGWPPPGWRFVLCDVGQGDMAVLPTGPATAVVVDAGPDPAAADACLRALGIDRVSLLVLSHFHADHVEGVPGVLRGRTVGAVEVTALGSPPGEQARVLRWAADAGVPVQSATPGEHRTTGSGVSWDVLWPDGALGPATPGANNASIALLVTLADPAGPADPADPSDSAGPADPVDPAAPRGSLRLALLGDLEPPAQEALLRHGHPLGRVDVLKVAHHGSAHQDWALAEVLRPRLALISCGAGNPYGHPSPVTVDRLRALGATVLRTDRSGDVAVLGTGRTGIAVATHPSGAPG